MNYLHLFADYTIHNNINSKHDQTNVMKRVYDEKLPFTLSCIPIAKQIVYDNRKITINVPKKGDVLMGLLHNKIIDKVEYIFNNYTEEYILEAKLVDYNDCKMWIISNLPIPLLVINDYDHITISLVVYITPEYSIQCSFNDVFLACYGYCNQVSKEAFQKTYVYEIPLIHIKKILKIICGIWTIHFVK